jgi:hypothetical protein
MDNLTPTGAIQLFRILATIDWRELNASDHDAFADAGPDARIAELNATQHSTLAELLDFRAPADMGILAIIGGDALTLELHSVDDEGSPIWAAFPIAFTFD